MYEKGITLVSLITTIIVLIILTMVSITIVVETIQNETINTNQINQQEICNHEWVITSKYDYMKECYKTISKCSKCGKEVE